MKFTFYLRRRQINLKSKIKEGKWKTYDDLFNWCTSQSIDLDIGKKYFDVLLGEVFPSPPPQETSPEPEPEPTTESQDELQKNKKEEPQLEIKDPDKDVAENSPDKQVDYSKFSTRMLKQKMKVSGLRPSGRMKKHEMVEELQRLDKVIKEEPKSEED